MAMSLRSKINAKLVTVKFCGPAPFGTHGTAVMAKLVDDTR